MSEELDVSMEVKVFQYGPIVFGAGWHYGTQLTLKLEPRNHEHPPAILVKDGKKELFRAPLEQFAEAVNWLINGAPR